MEAKRPAARQAQSSTRPPAVASPRSPGLCSRNRLILGDGAPGSRGYFSSQRKAKTRRSHALFARPLQ